jgi:hypothetical protein
MTNTIYPRPSRTGSAHPDRMAAQDARRPAPDPIPDGPDGPDFQERLQSEVYREALRAIGSSGWPSWQILCTLP